MFKRIVYSILLLLIAVSAEANYIDCSGLPKTHTITVNVKLASDGSSVVTDGATTERAGVSDSNYYYNLTETTGVTYVVECVDGTDATYNFSYTLEGRITEQIASVSNAIEVLANDLQPLINRQFDSLNQGQMLYKLTDTFSRVIFLTTATSQAMTGVLIDSGYVSLTVNGTTVQLDTVPGVDWTCVEDLTVYKPADTGAYIFTLTAAGRAKIPAIENDLMLVNFYFIDAGGDLNIKQSANEMFAVYITENYIGGGGVTLGEIEGSSVIAKETTLANATYGLSALQVLLDAIATSSEVQAMIDVLKGAGWTTETLKAIKDSVDLKLATSGYTAPDNTSIGTILTETQSHPTLAEVEASTVLAKEATLNNATYGLSALNTDIDALLARLTALRAGYLDNLSAGAVGLQSTLDNVTYGLSAIKTAIGSGGISAQQVRDAMKLAPTAGAAATDSIDDKIDSIDTGSGATITLPVMQGQAYTAVALQSKEVRLKRGDTPIRLYFDLNASYTAWTPYFAMKRNMSDDTYIVDPVAAVWTSAANGEGYYDITGSSAFALGKYYAEIELRNGDSRLTGIDFRIEFLQKVIE